jgi:hypothetical protein
MVSGLPQSTLDLRRTLRETNTSLSVSVLGQSAANSANGDASNSRSSLYRALRTSDVFNLSGSAISTLATRAHPERQNSTTTSNAIRSFNSRGRISSITEEVDYSPSRRFDHESAVVDTSKREANNESIGLLPNPHDKDSATPIPLSAHNYKNIANSTRDEQSRQPVSFRLPNSTDIESVLQISHGNLARPESFRNSYLGSMLSEEFLPNGANDSNRNTCDVELNTSSSGNFEDEMTESDNLSINGPASPTFSTSNDDNAETSQFSLEDEVKTESSSSDSDSKTDEVG